MPSILLTDNEKLVARQIWAHHLQDQSFPEPEKIAEVLDIPTNEVNDGISILSRLGFLSLPESAPNSGYNVAEDADRFHEGLGFSFHTVTLDNQETFGIPWSVDFLLLVSSQYREHRIKLDDACAHCVDRIQIEADKGQLLSVSPDTSIVYQGGTWGQNNLFRSEEHLAAWFGGEMPTNGTWMPVGEFMEAIVRER